MKHEKRSKLKNIKDIKELIQITTTILNQVGFNEIKKIDKLCVSANWSVPNVGTYKHLYIHSIDALNKQEPLNRTITNSIDKYLDKDYVKYVIISNEGVSNGFIQKIEGQYPSSVFEYWGTDELLQKIEDSYYDYWHHNDQALLKYEKDFKKYCDEINDIKRIVNLKDSYKKMVEVFIEPQLYRKTKDIQSAETSFEIQKTDDLVGYSGLTLIVGEAGSGKTRILKELALKLTDENKTNSNKKKNLPVFINATNLNNNKEANKISLCNTIKSKLYGVFQKSIDEIIKKYKLYIFIDTIDEFEDRIQKGISEEIDELIRKGCTIFLGTRLFLTNQISGLGTLNSYEEVQVLKFNDDQVRQFVTRYFNGKKASGLLSSLRQNKIIEKLPITPLNLSLISLLYEENNFEIPATITDIYKNFSDLLLGRVMVDERFKFLDITLKENILSIYALKLLRTPNNEFLTRENFIKFFEEEFKGLSGSIDHKVLPDALDYIIKNTGFLTVHEEKYIKFRHDSYMEYFAALEVQNNSKYESLLIENFFNVNWQFAAVFYAGFKRRRVDLLTLITKKVQTANNYKEFAAGIGGIGYIVQALYLTPEEERKKAILIALDKLIELYELTKKLGTNKNFKLYKDLKVNLIAILNSFIFFENFNSITIKESLKLAFNELLNEYKASITSREIDYIYTTGFKMFTLALTLSSIRIGEAEEMTKLIWETKLLNDPFFENLVSFGLEVVDSSPIIKKLKAELKKKHKRNSRAIAKKSPNQYFPTKSSVETYLSKSLYSFRFSKYDKIRPKKDFKLITEGKTDALIIEHAFMVLTNFSTPYWEIIPSHEKKGGARKLANILMHSGSTMNKDSQIIGVFDNDASGIQEFKGGLKGSSFEKVAPADNGVCRVKKHKEYDIYGMLLPIPHHMQRFIDCKEQSLNYFAIEHYFPKDYLKKNNMIRETKIPGIYKIKDKKKAFSAKVIQEKKHELFEDFIYLFKTLDKICGKEGEINYKF